VLALGVLFWAQAFSLVETRCRGTPVPTELERPPAGHAPPPALPVQVRRVGTGQPESNPAQLLSAPPGLTLYTIGDPTDEEQLYLEDVNRARKDPAAEGLRLANMTDPDVLSQYQFFSVDLALMAQQFAAINPAPPLSMNSNLISSARSHSQDMLAHEFQGHNGTDGSLFTDRALAAGYHYQKIGENVFSYAHSVEEGHDAFEVDWGGDASTGGMQSPPGHRENIHDPNFVEIGIGVIDGTNGTVGPQLVTEDLGSRAGLTPFITGVVYYDFNGNGSYDLGEGIGGVTVLAQGSSYYAVTANSGGYSLPVPGAGTYPVTFTISGLAPAPMSATVVGSDNLKLDYHLAYSAPTISGPDKPAVNLNNSYSFTPVGGATSYQWKQDVLTPAPAIVDGAENGLANVTAMTSPGYSVLDSTIKASGNFSFHLAHPASTNAPPVDQFLTLNPTFRASSTTLLQFASLLGWATTQQVAHAQVSIDGGQTWKDVWSQAGLGSAGEQTFTTHSISLAALAGQSFQLRFAYTVGGSFFTQTDPGVGFYIDNIGFSNASVLTGEAIADISSGTSFGFAPGQVGSYSLAVRPKITARVLPWGPDKVVTAQIGSTPGTSVKISSALRLPDGRLQIQFAVTNPSSGSYGAQAATDPTGPWADDTSASIQVVQGNTTFDALVSPGAVTRRFYRIVSK
jgi:hypothetical protein